MKKILLCLLCLTMNVYAQDFRKVVEIVTDMETSLKKLIQQEQSQRKEDVAALQSQLNELRSAIANTSSTNGQAVSASVEQRLAAIEQKIGADQPSNSLPELTKQLAALLEELRKSPIVQNAATPQATTPQAASAVPAEPKTLNFAFFERFRNESWDNSQTLSKTAAGGTSYMRAKTSFLTQWLPSPEAEVDVRLTNELRYYYAPSTKVFTSNEIFFDNLFVKYNFRSLAPVTMTIGRQNITWGEGFILIDGTPLDGSRSTYFNAARADIVLDPKIKISAFYSYQPTVDAQLPLVNDQLTPLVEQAEEGIGVCGNIDVLSANVQPYFLRKDNYASVAVPIESRINTTGARIRVPLADAWTFTGEGAYQFGSKANVDRNAYGGYAYVDFKTGLTGLLPKTLTGGYVYYSGDDQSTSQCEGWDPMFGRFPKWSESFVYTLIKESAIAYWSNLIIMRGQAAFAPWNGVGLTVEYQHLSAPQKAVSGAYPGGTGTNRGNLWIGRLSYKLSDVVTGYIHWERFVPGDYYFDGADIANWTRIEFLISL
jgi:hypothetical protein